MSDDLPRFRYTFNCVDVGAQGSKVKFVMRVAGRLVPTSREGHCWA